MKTLLTCMLTLLAAVSWAAPAEYFVRPDGSDTACSGLVNAPASQAPDCSFALPQRGADALNDRDDLTITSGQYPGFVLPAGIKGNPNNKVVIRGWGNPYIDAIGQWAIYVDSPQHIIFRDMNVEAGGKFALLVDGTASDVVVDGLRVDRFAGTCCADDQNLRAAAIKLLFCTDCQVINNVFVGDQVHQPLQIAGRDCMDIFFAGPNGIVENNFSTRMLGALVNEGGQGMLIRSNTKLLTNCRGDEGCIQAYNDPDTEVSFNVFTGIPREGSAWFRLRTSTGKPLITSGSFFNNTAVVIPNTAITARKIGIKIFAACPSACVFDSVNDSHFFNNIFIGNGDESHWDSGSIVIDDCVDPSATLMIGTNNYYDVFDDKFVINAMGCPIFSAGPDVLDDPQLDVNFRLPQGHASCTAGNDTFVSSHGTLSASFIGAFSCAEPGGGAHAPPMYK